MKKKTIDETDIQILNILSNAPSLPNNEIARRIKLSPSTTLERIRNLKKTGIFKRQFYLLNYDLLGYIHKVIIRLEIPKSIHDEIYYELQQRHIISILSYASPYAKSYQVDVYGAFRTERSIEKLCDKLRSSDMGIKVIGVYNIHKLVKLAPMFLQKGDTLK